MEVVIGPGAVFYPTLRLALMNWAVPNPILRLALVTGSGRAEFYT